MRLLVLVLVAATAVAEQCQPLSDAHLKGTLGDLQRLRQDIFCSYDKHSGPTPENSTIKFRLARMTMHVDEETNTLHLTGYTLLFWRDDWFDWQPQTYGNVTRLYADWEEVWTPRIALAEAPTKRLVNPGQVLLVDGTVIWTMYSPLAAPCVSDAHNWPYDTLVCNLTIVNLSHPGVSFDRDKLIVQFNKISMAGWIPKTIGLRNVTSVSHSDGISLEFTLKRAARKQEAAVVSPCVALGALLLAALWLPADSAQRPILLCTVLLLQILLLVIGALRVRVVAELPPGVLLLQRDALFLSGLSVLLWVLARWLAINKVRSADPVVAFLASSSGSRLSRLLVLKSGADAASSEVLAALWDRMTFVVLSIVFTGLCFRLVPAS